MRFAFSDEQEELRRTARSFLADHCPSEKVRADMDSTEGFDPGLWKRMTAELGWSAVAIPQAYGGYGLGPVEVAALMEEMGAVLLCSPFFSTLCLGANALVLAGSEQQKAEHLPRIASGEATATLALAEAPGAWTADGVACVARREGEDYLLAGTKTYVPDGHTADVIVVAARSEGSQGGEGVSLFCLPSDSSGLSRSQLPTMDRTRRQAELRLDGVRVPATALMGEEGTAWPAIAKTLDLAMAALAAEQTGGAQRCLDMSVAYAKERKQFGRAIGSFQAIKHNCADMMLKVESARSAAYYAAWAAAEDTGDLPEAASLAKAYCSDAYFSCAAEAIQIHGGVGFSWEYDVHLYFKRAKSSETLLGDAAFHREQVASRIGL